MTMLITPDDRIFVAGDRGMVGSAICRALQRSGYENLLTASRDQLDLLDLQAVQHWFASVHSPHSHLHSGLEHIGWGRFRVLQHLEKYSRFHRCNHHHHDRCGCVRRG